MNLQWYSGREIGLLLFTSIERNSLLTLSTKGTWSWNIIWSSPLILRGPLRCSIRLVIVSVRFTSLYVLYLSISIYVPPSRHSGKSSRFIMCFSWREGGSSFNVRWRQRTTFTRKPVRLQFKYPRGISFMSIISSN